MDAALIGASVVAVLGLISSAMLSARARRTRRTLDTTNERVVALSGELDLVRYDRSQQATRADRASSDRAELGAQVRALRDESTRATEARDRALEQHHQAQSALAELQSRPVATFDASALWDLEVARTKRRWQVSVAPGIDLTSPLESCVPSDRPQVALDILAQAWREESGVSITVDWRVETALTPLCALMIVRVADEILAAGSLTAETITLTVREYATGVELWIEARDETDAPLTRTAVAALLASADPFRANASFAFESQRSSIRIPIPAGATDRAAR
jgi:hypothetical protein